MTPKIIIQKVCDGLGLGFGSISRRHRESQAGNEGLGRVTDYTVHNLRILVPIDVDDTGAVLTDDGCGDGRPVSHRAGAVFTLVDGKPKHFARSLHRAKVFGGGATMAVAMRIGLGEAAGETLKVAFKQAMEACNAHGVDYGAHTDTRAEGRDCGCGAIDNAPAILQAIKNNQAYIINTIKALGVDTHGLRTIKVDGKEIPGVLDHFAAAADVDNSEYAGSAIMQAILANGKIVKELAGDHRTTRIVLNFVEGHTVDQDFVRKQTADRAQAFAVDTWRLAELASMLYKDAEQERRALLSELVYTLGTAAVLTDGTLPVYAVTIGV
ncbi:MAG TPA: cadmium-containing carbonic anhydrase [Candidatus Saccharimonadales bacterium]|nr:cadmium-containing carbonic anhydrase [Candidatus Saccharimonadales bacterium]